ncbi:Transportin-1, partial [Grifola frondosa]
SSFAPDLTLRTFKSLDSALRVFRRSPRPERVSPFHHDLLDSPASWFAGNPAKQSMNLPIHEIHRRSVIYSFFINGLITEIEQLHTSPGLHCLFSLYPRFNAPRRDRIRTIAGYLLKNNARLVLRASVEITQFVKSSVLAAFNDPNFMIRNAAGQDIVAFLGILEPKNWPECLQQLVQMLDQPNLEQQEAAFNVLEKACEDYLASSMLRSMGLGHWTKMRSHAIACLSYSSPSACQSLFAHLDTFIACLFKRASDEDSSVRRHVCQALVLLLASRPEKLMPEMGNVAEYMLYSTNDKNENVALEACEFWLTFAEDPDLAPYLHPLLGKVAPMISFGWRATRKTLLFPDKESDIKPRHYGGKSHGLEREANGVETSAKRVGAYGEEFDEDEDDEGFDDLDDDEFAEEMSTEWNLRKCAAAALDVLAVRFGPDLLNVLLEPLKTKLWSEEWLQRESGILALGAMAEGCIDAIEPHLPTLVPYLINTLNDPSLLCGPSPAGRWDDMPAGAPSQVPRSIRISSSCPPWKGFFAWFWITTSAYKKPAAVHLPLLKKTLDMNSPRTGAVFAFDKYQHKNMLILYDAVGTLADAVGPALQNPAYVDILMPSLTRRWSKLKDDDEDLVPLLECLASVTIAMGPAFLPYAGPIFDRCATIVHTSLLQYQAYQQNLIWMSLIGPSWLLHSIYCLGMALEPSISRSQPNLLSLLTVCLKHPKHQCDNRHMPCYHAGAYRAVGSQPKFEFVSACNNAAWSVGEIALRYGRDDPEFQQWVHPLISRLIPILLHPKAPRSLHENAAVSIGRIGLMHPALIAPLLPEFAQAWCQALYEIRDNEEKDSAFRGLCTLVQTNPAGIAKSLLWFCNAIVRWNQPSPELNTMFQQLLNGFKQHDAVGWAAQVATFPL